MWSWLCLVLGLVYVVYRISLPLRAVKAEREGDVERANQLRLKGSLLTIGTAGALTLLLVIWIAVSVGNR